MHQVTTLSYIFVCICLRSSLFVSLQCNKEDEISCQQWPSLYNHNQKDSLVAILAYTCTDYSDHTMKTPKDLEESSSVELIDSVISPSQNLAHSSYNERDHLTVTDSMPRVRTFLIVGFDSCYFWIPPFLCYVVSNGH